MKIAFYGGSFDPPHIGHDEIVKATLKELDIDKLIIMPTFINPFKNEFSATPNLRYEWTKILWGKIPKVFISKFEIMKKRPVPTIESIENIYKFYIVDKLYLIIGADHLASINKWHNFDKLCELVEFVVAPRNNIQIPPNLQKLNLNVNISSSEIRQNLDFNKIPTCVQEQVKKFYIEGKKCKI